MICMLRRNPFFYRSICHEPPEIPFPPPAAIQNRTFPEIRPQPDYRYAGCFHAARRCAGAGRQYVLYCFPVRHGYHVRCHACPWRTGGFCPDGMAAVFRRRHCVANNPCSTTRPDLTVADRALVVRADHAHLRQNHAELPDSVRRIRAGTAEI